MAVFAYKGLNDRGRAVSGVIDADTAKTARLKLRKTGIFPTELTEQERGAEEGGLSRLAKINVDFGQLFERVTPQELAMITRQLATLVGAGLPLVDCLSALIDQLDTARVKRVFSQVREQVTEGASFADALKDHPRVFSDLYVSMVRAGEASGSLDVILLRLADYTESYAKLRDKVRSALTYPILMAIVSAGILFALLTFAVPQITRIFDETGQDLPVITQVLLAVSGFMQEYWWIIVLLVAIVGLLFRASIRTPTGRERYDRYVLKVPYAGTLLKKVALARFSRTLSTLLTSGITLLQALDIVKSVVNNTILTNAISEARNSIREGHSIAPPLQRSGLFPSMLVHMIAVGERSGELEKMLAKAAEAYDNEVEMSVASLTSIMEPVMILFMGGIVLFIVLAILLPIFEMNQLVT
jgi:general secretion pathway protein F